MPFASIRFLSQSYRNHSARRHWGYCLEVWRLLGFEVLKFASLEVWKLESFEVIKLLGY
jgi:hypothetical protein